MKSEINTISLKPILIIALMLLIKTELVANNSVYSCDTCVYNSKILAGVSINKVINKAMFAFSAEYLFKPYEKYNVGFHFNYGYVRTESDYGYKLQKPAIRMADFAVVYQYILFCSKKFEFNFNFLQGITKISIEDQGQMVKYTDNNGNESERPKEFDYSIFYYCSAGFEETCQFDKRVGMSVKGCYRLLIGNSPFGPASDFSDFSIQIKLSWSF